MTFCIFTFQFKGTMMIDQNEIKSAFNHFVMGWHFITQKGLRRFVIMPILLNIVLLTGLFWLFVSQISTMIDWVMSFIPDWLSFLSVILLVLSIGSILLFFYLTRIHLSTLLIKIKLLLACCLWCHFRLNTLLYRLCRLSTMC